MLKHLFKKLPRVAVRTRGAFLGSSGKDERSAAVAALRAEIYYIVCGFYDIEIVLDYDDGVSSVGKLIYNAQKLMHIGHVQAGRRLVA